MIKQIVRRENYSQNKSLFLSKEELIVIGKLLKEKRELIGMSRSSLSNTTKISVAVLEAIEKGWIRQIPEKTYLLKMFITLEKELSLKEGTLKYLLKDDNTNFRLKYKKTFTPGSIHIFSNWQGTLIYFILLLISILILNRQQRYLSIKNTQTLQPLLPEELIDKIYEIYKDR